MGSGCFLSAFSKPPGQTRPDSLTAGRRILPTGKPAVRVQADEEGRERPGGPTRKSSPRPNPRPLPNLPSPVKAKENSVLRGPGGKAAQDSGSPDVLPPPRARLGYSHAGLQAEQGASARVTAGAAAPGPGPCGAPCRPASGRKGIVPAAPRRVPSYSPALTGRPRRALEPPPPRAPWPGGPGGRSHRCRARSRRAREVAAGGQGPGFPSPRWRATRSPVRLNASSQTPAPARGAQCTPSPARGDAAPPATPCPTPALTPPTAQIYPIPPTPASSRPRHTAGPDPGPQPIPAQTLRPSPAFLAHSPAHNPCCPLSRFPLLSGLKVSGSKVTRETKGWSSRDLAPQP